MDEFVEEDSATFIPSNTIRNNEKLPNWKHKNTIDIKEDGNMNVAIQSSDITIEKICDCLITIVYISTVE